MNYINIGKIQWIFILYFWNFDHQLEGFQEGFPEGLTG